MSSRSEHEKNCLYFSRLPINIKHNDIIDLIKKYTPIRANDIIRIKILDKTFKIREFNYKIAHVTFGIDIKMSIIDQLNTISIRNHKIYVDYKTNINLNNKRKQDDDIFFWKKRDDASDNKCSLIFKNINEKIFNTIQPDIERIGKIIYTLFRYNKKFIIIEMSDTRDARRVLVDFNNKIIDDTRITVEYTIKHYKNKKINDSRQSQQFHQPMNQQPIYQPSYQQLTYQQPINQQPTYQQPTYQQPINQQPTYQQPINQQPVYQQPTYQQPAYQQPTYQQPTYQQPAYQQPVYQQPAYQQPNYQQSNASLLIRDIIQYIEKIGSNI